MDNNIILNIDSKLQEVKTSLDNAKSLVNEISSNIRPGWEYFFVDSRFQLIVKCTELEIYARALRDKIRDKDGFIRFQEWYEYDVEPFDPHSIIEEIEKEEKGTE